MSRKQPEPQTEFSRPLDVARVPKLGSHENLVASTAECTALARRLNVPVIHSLKAKLHVKPWRGGGLHVKGTLVAELDRESVVSLEAFLTTEELVVERFYLAAPKGEDLETDEDIDPIQDGLIDLGELVAETLALDMDPYPRKPGESFQGPAVDETPLEPEKPNPFNVLSFPRKD
jgi:uncharacterized metal-binding protein YceD (DUF177 family)